MMMLSPHQIRQVGALAFRNRQRGLEVRPIGGRAHLARPTLRAPAPPVCVGVSIEEQLCAAAHRILSDGRAHSLRAQTWAVQLLERCTPGGDRTAFLRSALRRASRAYA